MFPGLTLAAQPSSLQYVHYGVAIFGYVRVHCTSVLSGEQY